MELMKRVLNSQFIRYGLVGGVNLFLSIIIFNFFMWLFSVSQGIAITIFSFVTFALVVTHSFFWNKFLVFKSKETSHRREYIAFFIVSGTVALINVGIISFLVNGLGAPSGISSKLWANIALFITIPVAVLGNFFGYKLLVFRTKGNVGVTPTETT